MPYPSPIQTYPPPPRTHPRPQPLLPPRRPWIVCILLDHCCLCTLSHEDRLILLRHDSCSGSRKNIQEIQDQIVMPMSCLISTLCAHTHMHACTYTHRRQEQKNWEKYEEAMHQAKCPQGCHQFWYKTTLHFHEIIWLHFTVCALDISNKRVQQQLPLNCQHPTLQTAMSGLKTMWYPPTECATRHHELLWPSSKAPGRQANRPTECATRHHELLWPSSKAPGRQANRPTECATRHHELLWPSSKAPGRQANRHWLDSPLQHSFFFKHCGSCMHSDCNCASPQL